MACLRPRDLKNRISREKIILEDGAHAKIWGGSGSQHWGHWGAQGALGGPGKRFV